MPAPATASDFLDLVRQSGLLDGRRLDAYAERLRQGGELPHGPAPLADRLVRDGLLTDFQAGQLLRGRWQGFVLGAYRLCDRLGAGGMGTVFLAEHRETNRPVALKVLPSARARDPVRRGRFLREAQAAAALNHPNIVRAYELGAEGPVFFLALEYVEGDTLQELVDRDGPLPIRAACDYVRQAALGLQHAHDAGLVHRDVKPANLLVDGAGGVKVLDLGLARFVEDDSDELTCQHDGRALLGTADYLAPEQGRDSHDVGAPADVYSLGATFFFALAGRPPFEGGTLKQKLLWHQMKPPPDVRGARGEVPGELAELVARMLAKDPGRRPQTLAGVAEELASTLASPRREQG